MNNTKKLLLLVCRCFITINTINLIGGIVSKNVILIGIGVACIVLFWTMYDEALDVNNQR